MAEPSGRQKHRLILMPSGLRGEVPAGTDLLQATADLGVDLESICGGRQTCGKCVVTPQFGRFDKHGIQPEPAGLSAVGPEERRCAEKHGVDLSQDRLACAAQVQGDVLLDVPAESLARKQVIRKEAGDLALEIAPDLQLFYLETEEARLGGPSDFRRLRAALVDQWQLEDIGIDPVLLPQLSAALRAGNGAVTATIWQKGEIVRLEPGYDETLLGLAVDVGSTTVAAYLNDLRTGELLATAAAMNPQVRHGEDLMSRVSYAMREKAGTERMHRAIIRVVNELADEVSERAGVGDNEIGEILLVGNTVMHHLLLGIDPRGLGGAPFALTVKGAVEARARDFGLDSLHPGARLHTLPCIAGHVGADCAGVLLSQMDRLDDRVTLIVDIGTNAEILLAKGERVMAASSPTGPALEGAQVQHGQRAAPGAIERVRIDPENHEVRYKVVGDPRWSDEVDNGASLGPTGICGSGIVEAVGELFLAGWLDASGRLPPNGSGDSDVLRTSGRSAELVLAPAAAARTEADLVVTQEDIRAIQLAKAALYAGARLLMDRMGVERVDRIMLAGAFGSYLDPKYAMTLGLIPDCGLEEVHSIGNAAGDGARIALLNVEKRGQLDRALARIEYVETAMEPLFQEHFVAAMSIPHGEDPFPHLTDLPSRPGAGAASKGRRRRRRQSRRKR